MEENKKPADIEPGTVIGKCRIQKVLGHGGMGTVYQGYHQGLQCEVAIKILHKSNVEELQSFFNEAQAIARLEHPNIMKIYDIEHDSTIDKHYILAQFIPGKSLENLLVEKKNFEPLEALRIMVETTKGLSYAHQKGIIHRDIKPANIMMDGQGHIKITDFGLAYTMDVETDANQAGTQKKKIAGTPLYMAPEQCRGDKLDERTDIYALGGTFYELLSGQPPFGRNTSIPELIESHLYRNPMSLEHINPQIPPILNKCIRKMMAKDANDRFQNCTELLQHLEEISLELNKVRCPRCGKENTGKEVFHCPRCGTKNLCLSHLVANKQHCDQCEKLATESLKSQSTKIHRNKWLETLDNIYATDSQGLFYADSGPEHGLMLCIMQNTVEFKIKASYQELIASYPIQNDADKEMAHRKIIQYKLLEAQAWESPKFRFHAITKQTRAMPLMPPNYATLSTKMSGRAFLRGLIGALRIQNAGWNPGGIAVQTGSQNLSIFFTETGVALTKQNQEFIVQEQDVVQSIQTMFQPNSIFTCLNPISYPPIKADALFPLPDKKLLMNLIQCTPWEELGRFLPELSFLSSTTSFPSKWQRFGTLQVISSVLCPSFSWNDWIALCGKAEMSPCTATLAFVLLSKEWLQEIINTIFVDANAYFSQNSMDDVSEKVLESLLQASPENLEILTMWVSIATSLYLEAQKDDSRQTLPQHKSQEHYLQRIVDCLLQIGDIHVRSGKFSVALTNYQQALQYNISRDGTIQYAAGYENTKSKIFDVHHKQHNKDNVKKVGLELLPILRKKGISGESRLQEVCEILLDVDSGLVECRKDLINIHLNRNNVRKAINEYETLAEFYKKGGNKEQLIQCYSRILKLDASREDIRQKLIPLQQTDTEDDILDMEPGSAKLRLRTILGLTLGLLFLVFLVIVMVVREKRQWRYINLAMVQIETGAADEAEISLQQTSGFLCFTDIAGQKEMLEQKLKAWKENEEKRIAAQQEQKRQEFKLLDIFLNEWQDEQNPAWNKAAEFCKGMRKCYQDIQTKEYFTKMLESIEERRRKSENR